MNYSEFLDMYYHGPIGETLFHAPYHRPQRDIVDAQKMMQRMQAYKDDRSMVLMAALVSEEYIDRLLGRLIPKYSKVLKASQDFTFSSKIKLLESFELIPIHLTKAADIVRLVRNQFAHRLDLDKLEDIDSKTKNKMRALYIARKIRTDSGPDDIRTVFWVLTILSTDSIYAYDGCIQDLIANIRNPAFEENLRINSEKRVKEYIDNLISARSN